MKIAYIQKHYFKTKTLSIWYNNNKLPLSKKMDDQNKFKSFQQQVFQLLEDIGSRLIHKAIDGLSSAC